MCVLALAWRAHPRWQLVMAGNRDELHERPAAPLARWEERADILAGRDRLAGGTWLGLCEQGRFAVVTNLRGYGPPQPGMASRGALVRDLLAGDGLHADADRVNLAAFNPFNLIMVDAAGARFLTNRPGSTRAMLAPGLYGLSNGTLDAPWPKTMQLKTALADWLAGAGGTATPLFDALRSETLTGFGIAPDEPSDVPQEARQSPVFIRNPIYGTRCSTVVMLDAKGQGRIIERRFDARGEATGETALEFGWPVDGRTATG